ncbi:hypothetical protein FOA43_002135 [Brettanomyces nanus]|uniref:Uncharacterized protein n=1 Tax=Eeniella nana TaxID=13502 RepID=A0A875S4V4_EENNA|nr:uncharacterized protein FOA43_002135 [Brettanomyces nanus]QPG74799.1 hypothetical protein FOA43_002135 [Brettanomyces nanus]
MAFTKAKFHNFFVDWFSVLKGLDKRTGILSVSIPLKEDFFEDNVRKINYSILRYMDSLKDEVSDDSEPSGQPKLENSTSIEEKFESKEYKTVYEMFHDLKIASVIKMVQVEDDLDLYGKVDTFFRVGSELLLRECLRLGLTVEDEMKKDNEDENEKKKQQKRKMLEEKEKEKEEEEEKEGEEEGEDETEESGFGMETSLEEALARDFELITGTYIDKAGEALSIVAAGNLPLFTSLNKKKSELDDREPVIDAGLGVNLVKIVPNLDSVTPEKLTFVSPVSQQPVSDVREVLQEYIHPNWLRLTSPQWLKNGDYDMNFSFAPSYDESKSTVSNEWKGLTWMQEVGFEKFKEAKREKKEKTDEKAEEAEEAEKAEKAEEAEKAEKAVGDSDEESEEPIDLGNLFKWNIGNKIDEHEKDVIADDGVQEEISKLMLELNHLRKSRITFQKQQLAAQQQLFVRQAQQGADMSHAEYKVLRTSKQEVEKYHRLKRLMTGLLRSKDINPDKLNLKLSTRLPVLQHNYTGMLPASFGGNSHYGRYGGSSRNRRRR